MCWSVKANGKWCRTMGELRKALYPDTHCIVIAADYPQGSYSENTCLCPLDREATAAKLGLTVHTFEDGDCEFV